MKKLFVLCRRAEVVEGVEHLDKFVSQLLSGAGSSPVRSIIRDLNFAKTPLLILND